MLTKKEIEKLATDFDKWVSYKPTKAYKKMMRKAKKAILSKAKIAAKSPYDYGPHLELFVEGLRFMRDYYQLGENVWGADAEHRRLETLNRAIFAYETWQYFEFDRIPPDDDPLTAEELRVSIRNAKAEFFLQLFRNIEEWWD